MKERDSYAWYLLLTVCCSFSLYVCNIGCVCVNFWSGMQILKKRLRFKTYQIHRVLDKMYEFLYFYFYPFFFCRTACLKRLFVFFCFLLLKVQFFVTVDHKIKLFLSADFLKLKNMDFGIKILF